MFGKREFFDYLRTHWDYLCFPVFATWGVHAQLLGLFVVSVLGLEPIAFRQK